MPLGALAQDSLKVITLEDVAVIDFRTEHDQVFKNLEISNDMNIWSLSSSLEEALKSTTPVYFKNYSYGGISTIDFRGTGAERTQVYWNGVPINSPSLGVFDFSLLPSFFISDAKVRFGGASLVDGGGGIGGSIQLNQNNNFSKNSVTVVANSASFSNYSGGVIAKFISGKLKSDSRVLYHQGKNDFSFVNDSKYGNPTENRVNNELWRFSIQQAFNYDLNSSSSIAINALYSTLDRNIPPGVSSSAQGAWQGDDLFLGQLAYNKIFKKGMFLKVRSAYQNQENKFVDVGVDALNSVNAWNNKLDFGADIGNSLKFNTSIRYDLNKVITQGTGEVVEHVFSALLAADYTLFNTVFLSGGVRFEKRSANDSPLMPYIGMSWIMPKRSGELKANVSRVFRFPTINELYWQPGGNKDLQPENGWNYELSYLINRKGNRLYFDFQLSAFYSRVSNWILWYPSVENGMIWKAQNIWEVEAKGFEVNSGLNLSLAEHWNIDWRICYTFNASQISSDSYDDQTLNGKQLILVPKHQFMLPISLDFKEYSLGLSYNYTSERYTDRQNTNALDPYHLLDLVAAYNFTKADLEITFRLKNILNQQFETFPGQPLPGINFNIQVAWQLL